MSLLVFGYVYFGKRAMSSSVIFMLLVINTITFVMYGLDKLLAIKKKRRIRESTLLLLTILMGSVGAILAMLLFHHKTRKWQFRSVSTLSFILQIYVLYLVYFSM